MPTFGMYEYGHSFIWAREAERRAKRERRKITSWEAMKAAHALKRTHQGDTRERA